MNNKGQGAMEYLMTYGWAILVVIIVGIVLWQSGVFGTSAGGISGFSKIRVEDYSFDADEIVVSFENAAGRTLRTVVTTVSVNGAAAANMSSATGTTQANWAPGKEYALNFTDITTCTDVGAGYSLDFEIAYVSEANIEHTETGTIRGTCE